jgi:hypothetical protein
MILELALSHSAIEFRAVNVFQLAAVLTLSHLLSLPSFTVEGEGRSWRVVETARAFRLSGPAKISSEVRTAR